MGVDDASPPVAVDPRQAMVSPLEVAPIEGSVFHRNSAGRWSPDTSPQLRMGAGTEDSNPLTASAPHRRVSFDSAAAQSPQQRSPMLGKIRRRPPTIPTPTAAGSSLLLSNSSLSALRSSSPESVQGGDYSTSFTQPKALLAASDSRAFAARAQVLEQMEDGAMSMQSQSAQFDESGHFRRPSVQALPFRGAGSFGQGSSGSGWDAGSGSDSVPAVVMDRVASTVASRVADRRRSSVAARAADLLNVSSPSSSRHAVRRRRKELRGTIRTLRHAFKAVYKVNPTDADIARNAEFASTVAEYKDMKTVDVDDDASDASESSASPQARRAPLQQRRAWHHGADLSPSLAMEDASASPRHPFMAASPAESRSEQHAARKRLKKTIKAWRDAFGAQHGHEPTPDDIAADTNIAPVYDEYLELKAHAADDDVAEAMASPSLTADSSMSPRVTRAGRHRDASPAKAKKTLNRVLCAWREAFAAEHGRAPNEDDITANADIAPVYNQYLAAKAAVAAAAGATADDASPVLVMEDLSQSPRGVREPVKHSADPVKMKRRLGRVLTEWREYFAAEHGRQPTAHDLQNDPEIAPVYLEYLEAKAGAAEVLLGQQLSPPMQPSGQW
jgi:hypothetical protein